eukprot:1601235-Rhodomonas_salina.1
MVTVCRKHSCDSQAEGGALPACSQLQVSLLCRTSTFRGHHGSVRSTAGRKVARVPELTRMIHRSPAAPGVTLDHTTFKYPGTPAGTRVPRAPGVQAGLESLLLVLEGVSNPCNSQKVANPRN